MTKKGRKSAPDTRALGLFVVRESDEWDRELFNAMRENTYIPHRGVAAVEAIRKAGMAPFSTTGEFTVKTKDGKQRVIVEVIRQGRTKAILFCYQGYWHLWSQASATKEGDKGVNEFTAIMIEVIKRLRPREMYAANFGRLVRSQKHGNLLQAALSGNVDTLWAGGFQIQLSGEFAAMGMMTVGMFSTIASMERDFIVQRLLAGRIAKWRRGEWAFGHGTVPFGYMLNANKQLVPDLSKRDMVREMLLILGSTDAPSEKKRQLNDAGVMSMRAHRRLKGHVPVGAMQASSALISSLYAWAALWCFGEYLFRVENVFADMQELAGVPIVRHKGMRRSDMGELQMLYKPGVPEGGWAEPEVLQKFLEQAIATSSVMVADHRRTEQRPLSKAIKAQSANADAHRKVLNPNYMRALDHETQRRRSGSRAKRRITALTGRFWRRNGYHYELQMGGANLYRLVRWRAPAGDATDDRSSAALQKQPRTEAEPAGRSDDASPSDDMSAESSTR